MLLIVDNLNLSKIENKYSNLGQHVYDPKIMVSLLFYGYSIGTRSSRKISQGCEDRFDFAFLADGFYPSHDRLADFRRSNIKELKDIFKIIVIIGSNLGLAKLGNIKVSIDGAKIKANASSKLTKDEDGLLKLLEDVDKEINSILEEAEKVDNIKDEKYGKENRGNELPKKKELLKLIDKIVNEKYAKFPKSKKIAMKDCFDDAVPEIIVKHDISLLKYKLLLGFYIRGNIPKDIKSTLLKQYIDKILFDGKKITSIKMSLS